MQHKSKFKSIDLNCYLSTVDVIKHKIQFVLSLKRIMQADQKGMFQIFDEHISFSHDMFHLVSLYDSFFVQNLYGVYFILMLMIDHVHLAKTAFANHTQKLKIRRLCSTKFNKNQLI